MDAYRKRPGPGGKTVRQAQIRRAGYPLQSSTVNNKGDAEAWGRKTKAAMDAEGWVDCRAGRRTLLCKALARYEKEVIPDKALSSQRTGRNRLRRVQKQPFAKTALAHLYLRINACAVCSPDITHHLRLCGGEIMLYLWFCVNAQAAATPNQKRVFLRRNSSYGM